MAHEIERNDHLVLHAKRAWHGLGTIVEKAPTPLEALELAKMNWDVLESETLCGKFFNNDTEELYSINSDERKMLIRSDDHTPLGIVGSSFVPVQNQTVAELCYEIAGTHIGDKSIEVESAGSLNGGKRTWFLLKTNTLNIGGEGDIVKQYLAICNGHDGSMALSFLNTDIRVVCANTFAYAINRSGASTATLRHTTNILENIPAVIEQLKSGMEVQDGYANSYRHMQRQELTTQRIQEIWTNVYMKLWGDPKKAPYKQTGDTDKNSDRYEKAVARREKKMFSTLGRWSEIWQQEVDENGLGANAWTAYNAVTNFLDHEKTMRVRNASEIGSVRETQQQDARIASNIFGSTSDQKRTVYETFMNV